MRSTIFGAATFAALLMLSACGGGDAPDTPSGEPPILDTEGGDTVVDPASEATSMHPAEEGEEDHGEHGAHHADVPDDGWPRSPFLSPPAEALVEAAGEEAAGEGEEVAAEPEPEVEVVALTFESDRAAPANGAAGKVFFAGPRPGRQAIRMSADAACESLHDGPVGSEEALVTADHEVLNVFVYAKNGGKLPAGPEPTKPAVLDQDGCMYRPRVQGVQTGQDLEIVNSDPTAHNVHGFSEYNPFNFAQPTPGSRAVTFRRVETPVTVKCDIHPWMQSFVFVLDHGYHAVTDNTGAFALPNLPAGTHTLVAWHERFGEIEQEVTVPEGGGTDVTLVFQP